MHTIQSTHDTHTSNTSTLISFLRKGAREKGEVPNYFRDVRGRHRLSPPDLELSLRVNRTGKTSGELLARMKSRKLPVM